MASPLQSTPSNHTRNTLSASTTSKSHNPSCSDAPNQQKKKKKSGPFYNEYVYKDEDKSKVAKDYFWPEKHETARPQSLPPIKSSSAPTDTKMADSPVSFKTRSMENPLVYYRDRRAPVSPKKYDAYQLTGSVKQAYEKLLVKMERDAEMEEDAKVRKVLQRKAQIRDDFNRLKESRDMLTSISKSTLPALGDGPQSKSMPTTQSILTGTKTSLFQTHPTIKKNSYNDLTFFESCEYVAEYDPKSCSPKLVRHNVPTPPML